MSTKVRDAMTPGVQVASPSQTLVDAAALMRENDVGSLPVVQEGQLVGMLTDRDIVVRIVAEGADPRKVSVGDVASREIVTIGPDDELDEALRLMGAHRVRRLPVVEGGSIVGVLAQADVAIDASDRKSGALLEEISQPSSTERD
ncbi:MAG TPA: CBS domain-containing protein [Gaiellaceae bacterium]|jgi:CBS domain-containing protein